MLGGHRQALNRVLKTFEADGVVALSYGAVTLRDAPALRRLAGR